MYSWIVFMRSLLLYFGVFSLVYIMFDDVECIFMFINIVIFRLMILLVGFVINLGRVNL